MNEYTWKLLTITSSSKYDPSSKLQTFPSNNNRPDCMDIKTAIEAPPSGGSWVPSSSYSEF